MFDVIFVFFFFFFILLLLYLMFVENERLCFLFSLKSNQFCFSCFDVRMNFSKDLHYICMLGFLLVVVFAVWLQELLIINWPFLTFSFSTICIHIYNKHSRVQAMDISLNIAYLCSQFNILFYYILKKEVQ